MRVVRMGVVALLALAPLWSCGGNRPPPSAGEAVGVMPSLIGLTVMVLPIQVDRGVAPNAESEMVFALGERGQLVEWVFPDDLRDVVARSPGIPVDPDALSVGPFFQTEVQRMGDPLFGQLVRLNALTGAPVALIPLEVRNGPANEAGEAAIEIFATVMNPRDGRVFWTGVVSGRPGRPGDPERMATAAAQLAFAIVR